MKEKKRFCRYAKKATVPILALAILLTAALVPIGAGPPGAYADTAGAKITLTKVSEDKLNDTVVLAASLSEVSGDGISAVEFKVSYPDVFTLAEVEDKHLMGEDENSAHFTGEEGANPYYMAFGNMDRDAGGVSTKTGELARFTFKVNDGKSVTADTNYTFQLEDVKAYRITNDDSDTAKTEYITVDTTSANYQYTPIAGDATAGDGGKITVTKPNEGTAQVKTETIETAVKNNKDSDITLDISSESAEDGKESIVISKEGAQAVSDAEKKLIINTDAGKLEFDSEAAGALGENAKETAITISLEKKTDKDSKGNAVTGVLNISINAVSNDENIKSFGTGTVKVDINIPEGLNKEEIKCMFYDLGKGQYKFIDGTATDGIYSFNTNHFSEYMLGDKDTLTKYVNSNNLKQGVKVSGQVQSYNPNNETVLTLKQSGQVVETTKIAATTGSGQQTQQFEFDAVSEGIYDLVVTKAGHLTYTINDVNIGNENIDLTTVTDKAYSTITLLAGDVNGDGSINVTDLNILWNAENFNKASGSANNALTDINGDGSINVTDLNILWNAANFNKGTSNCTIGLYEEG